MHALVHILASAVYAATKSDISQLGESRHRELTGTGVRVMTVYPGESQHHKPDGSGCHPRTRPRPLEQAIRDYRSI